MPNVITLPPDWEETQTQRRLVDQGEHTVEVDAVTEQADGRILAELKIMDEGQFQGWTLYDSFCLTSEPGKRLFKEFTEVIGIEAENGQLDLDQCVHKVLRVVVAHKAGKDEEVYANVVRHRTARS